MRLKYMYYLLKKSIVDLNGLQLKEETKQDHGSTYYRGFVGNWRSARRALTSVSRIPLFKNFCEEIVNDEEFSYRLRGDRDSFYIPHSVYLKYKPLYAEFLTKVDAIISFCEDAGFDISEPGFDIKMPHTESLGEFSDNFALLSKAISQCPYLNCDNEKIILKKTDIGSIWFEFCIAATGTTFILSSLAKIVDKCIKIKSHRMTVRLQEEQYRTAKLKGDLLEAVIEANKEVMNTVVSECVSELKEEIPNVSINNEDENRIKYTLNSIASLMDKGMEIYASIDSPEEIKDLFPSADEITALPLPPKLLENKSAVE